MDLHRAKSLIIGLSRIECIDSILSAGRFHSMCSSHGDAALHGRMTWTNVFYFHGNWPICSAIGRPCGNSNGRPVVLPRMLQNRCTPLSENVKQTSQIRVMHVVGYRVLAPKRCRLAGKPWALLRALNDGSYFSMLFSRKHDATFRAGAPYTEASNWVKRCHAKDGYQPCCTRQYFHCLRSALHFRVQVEYLSISTLCKQHANPNSFHSSLLTLQ